MDRYKISLLLDWLVIDYITLRQFPSPLRQDSTGRTSPQGSREYGHPGQWASDRAKAIADCLDQTDEALRDHLNHLPPPPRNRAEARVVNHAYLSLKARTDDLTDFPGSEAFIEEATSLHRFVGKSLGYSRPRKALSLPCPNCSMVPVFRTLYDDRRDVIECHQCGYEIKEQEYGLYARILVDELIAKADADLTDVPLQCNNGDSRETLP
jgi:hypothetical protein